MLLVLLFLAGITWSGIQMYRQELVLREQEAQMAQMQQQADALNEKYAALLEQAKDKGSLESIERYMRERFGMVKDDEWVLQVEEDD